MTAPRDPDRLIHAFLMEGEDLLHDQVYDAVRAEIEQKRQRAGIGPWRTPIMNRYVAIGLGAAAVIAVLLIGTNLLGGGSPLPGGAPSPSVAPSDAGPSVVPSTAAGLPEGPFAWFVPANPPVPPDDGPPITVTIPASGWTYVAEFGGLIKGDEVDNLPESAMLWASTRGGIYVYGDPCQYQTSVPDTPATTAAELVAAFAAQASRDASEPVDVTVGGYAGKMITLHVPDDAVFTDCEGGEFASYTVSSAGDLYRYQQGPGQIDDLYIVDVDDAIVIINPMYRQDTSTERIEEMRTIAESATFE